MLTLKELSLNNFLSHEFTTLKFSPKEKLLIDGKSGSGKSSIVEAIIWCLYGRGRSGNNRGLIKSGNNPAMVKLVLKDGQTYYQIRRGITKSGKNTFEVLSGKTLKELKPIEAKGTKELQAHLQDKVLHSSYLLFINSIAYPQDNIDNFVKQPANKKKDILLEIVNAAAYDEYYKSTKTLLLENKEQHERMGGKIEVIQERIDANIPQQIDIDNIEKEIKELSDRVNSKEVTLKQKSEQVNKLRDKNATNELYIKEFDRLKTENKKNNEELLGLNNKKNALEQENNQKEIKKIEKEIEENRVSLSVNEEIEKKRAEWNQKMVEILREKPIDHDFETDIEEINQKIIKSMQKKIELCPELNKECPIIVKERDSQVEILSQDLEKKRDEKRIYQEKLEAYTQKINALGQEPQQPLINITSLRDTIKEKEANLLKLKEVESNKGVELNTTKNKIKEIENKIKENSSKIKDLSSKIKNSLKEEMEAMEKEQDEIRSTVQQDQYKLIEKKNNLSFIKNTQKKIEGDKKELEKIKNKQKKIGDDIESLELLKGAFSPTGVKTIIIDYVLPKLEDRINSILGLLSNFTVRLDTQKEGVGEDVVREGLFINIFNEAGEKFDFDNYSGGERLKIIVAISEALSELQNIGFRILDELFVGLDEDSTEKFVDVINTLHSRFDQMLCITHLRGIKDVFENRVEVKKIDGTSKLTS